MVKTASFICGGDGLVAKSCPTLASPWGGSNPGSSVHGFSRQDYWSGLLLPPTGDLLIPGTEPSSPALAGGFFPIEPPGKPTYCGFSCVRLFATLWTEAPQGPLSMGFSRQEYWSGLPFPSPGIQVGITPIQGSNSCVSCLLHWQVDFFLSTASPGKSFM